MSVKLYNFYRGDSVESKYELHTSIMNNNYPLKIKLQKQRENGYIHWHDNLELLYFTKGGSSVINGNEELYVNEGEIVVFNSEALHYVKGNKENPPEYIIVQLDATYFEAMGFNFAEANICKIIKEEKIEKILKSALAEQQNALPYYRESVKAGPIPGRRGRKSAPKARGGGVLPPTGEIAWGKPPRKPKGNAWAPCARTGFMVS